MKKKYKYRKDGKNHGTRSNHKDGAREAL